MEFWNTFFQVCVLFLVVIAGFVANKVKIMDKEFDRRLSSLVINVTSPFIVLSSAMGSELPAKEDILPVLGYGTGCLVFMALCSLVLTKLLRVQGSEVGMYRFMFTFGNVAFIGIPVVGSLFGVQAIFYVAIMTIPFNLMLFTVGYFFVAGGAQGFAFKYRMLVSPPMTATYLTILIVVLDLKMPGPVVNACNLLGAMTIPGSLLIIGSSLADIPIRSMLGTPRHYLMCLLKLMVIPYIIYCVLLMTPLEKRFADVLTVVCAMPVAAYGTMFCLKIGLDPKTMAQGTFLSTFLSLASVPLLSVLL